MKSLFVSLVLFLTVMALVWFGYTQAEVKGADVSDRVAPPDRKEEADAIKERISNGESVNVETIRKRKDGSVFDVHLQSARSGCWPRSTDS